MTVKKLPHTPTLHLRHLRISLSSTNPSRQPDISYHQWHEYKRNFVLRYVSEMRWDTKYIIVQPISITSSSYKVWEKFDLCSPLFFQSILCSLVGLTNVNHIESLQGNRFFSYTSPPAPTKWIQLHNRNRQNILTVVTTCCSSVASRSHSHLVMEKLSSTIPFCCHQLISYTGEFIYRKSSSFLWKFFD